MKILIEMMEIRTERLLKMYTIRELSDVKTALCICTHTATVGSQLNALVQRIERFRLISLGTTQQKK